MKAALGVALVCALGCSRATTPPLDVASKPSLPRVDKLAVLPVAASSTTTGEAAAQAPAAVTSMLVAAAGRQRAWSVVDAGKVRAALAALPAGDPATRAGALASRTGADAALTAIVTLYRERVGTNYGASEGAAVSLRIFLVPASATEAVWKADYAIHQQPLTYNLWNLWEVLRGGPRWLTVDELARIGIDEAVDRLAIAVGGR